MPDFEALRAERNRKRHEWEQKMIAEGWQISHCHHDDNACYCNCGYTKGLDDPEHACEHVFDGEPYESPDGLMWSTTCSRCGITSMSHSMRMGM